MYAPGTVLDGMAVSLGSITFGTVDELGVVWRIGAEDGLQGWDSAEVRAEHTARQGDHGSWADPVYLGERPVTLAGLIEAPDKALLDDALDRLRAAVSLTDTPLVVYETVPKQATVRRSGKPLLTYITDRTARFSVLVTAADPRRYALDEQAGVTPLPSTTGGLVFPVTFPVAFSAATVAGEIRTDNAGTVETRPVLVIDGPVENPSVFAQYADGSVRLLAYSQTLAAGDQLVIDTDAHTVVLNGNASRRRFLAVPSGWPVIPAGQSVAFQFRSDTYNATALLTVRWRSAWM
ncbi:phage distal tail protein [Streptomyces sp. NPDC059970]|uniref:phage distal tail protein n=1 Tax=Streptomyces sp. NPDC059970 TaxID=3347019 RepID=UPI0036BC3447